MSRLPRRRPQRLTMQPSPPRPARHYSTRRSKCRAHQSSALRQRSRRCKRRCPPRSLGHALRPTCCMSDQHPAQTSAGTREVMSGESAQPCCANRGWCRISKVRRSWITICLRAVVHANAKCACYQPCFEETSLTDRRGGAGRDTAIAADSSDGGGRRSQSGRGGVGGVGGRAEKGP